MRISRISRASALAAATLAGALALTGCSTPSSAGPAPVASAAGHAPGAGDVQVLSALTITTTSLDGVFTPTAWPTWKPWSPSTDDLVRIGLPGLAACLSDLATGPKSNVTQVQKAYFVPTSGGADDASTPSVTPTGKKGAVSPPGAPTVSKPWIATTAAVYKTTADATAAVAAFGVFGYKGATPKADCTTPSSPAAGPRYIGWSGGVQNAWYGQLPMGIVHDETTKNTMSAVAQQRGRFVVVVYTVGDYSVTSTANGPYYVLKGDATATDQAAAAAGQLLGQLTNEVVSGG